MFPISVGHFVESSSDSDEDSSSIEFHEKTPRPPKPEPVAKRTRRSDEIKVERPLYIREKSNVFDIPDDEFLRQFRMNKKVFAIILNDIKHLSVGFRCNAIPPDIKLAHFLKFLGSGSYQNAAGNDFYHLSQARVSLLITEFLDIFEANFCGKWIKLPLSAEEEEKAKLQFQLRYGFPGVVGCVGCTHVQIKTPAPEIRHLYLNNKAEHSINVMAICDQNLVIRYVDGRHPGGNREDLIWESSRANQYFKSSYNEENDTWLLGDERFPCLPYLMAPYRNPEEPHEIVFNEWINTANRTIRKCFGVLKDRFRCLASERGLQYTAQKVTKIINTCCALHNACIFYKNKWPTVEEIDIKMEFIKKENVDFDDSIEDLNTTGAEIREVLACGLIT